MEGLKEGYTVESVADKMLVRMKGWDSVPFPHVGSTTIIFVDSFFKPAIDDDTKIKLLWLLYEQLEKKYGKWRCFSLKCDWKSPKTCFTIEF